MSGNTIDLARLFRRAQEGAQATCEWLEEEAHEAAAISAAVIRSAGHFIGACSLVAGSAYGAGRAVAMVRLPDSELVKAAVARAREAAALDERDMALVGLAFGVCGMLLGAYWLNRWWGSVEAWWVSRQHHRNLSNGE